jgi:alpha-D-glucose phosphate-specific phosphoglucomutase
MTTKIKFGTSGWRAIIADEFTFANVRIVTEGIARYLNSLTKESVVFIGYDRRFASEHFAQEAANILTAAGIRVQLSDEAVPTPAVSFVVRDRRLAGAVNITASHNPGEYNGIKFSGADGSPALPDVTGQIEKVIVELQNAGWEPTAPARPELVETTSIRDDYLRALATKVDLDVIRKSEIRLGYDALYGVGAGYLDHILRELGLNPFVLHSDRDVLFGGHHPEPDEENLARLRHAVLHDRLTLGLGTDGDADRFGVLDADGEYFYPNEIIALLLDYLVEARGWSGAVARTVATTHLIDRVARLHNLEVLETPVGFKYIGQYIDEDRIVLGGEESAGLAIRGHLPEKDGILACLLVAEMVAKRGKSLRTQLNNLFKQTGEVYNRRLKVDLEPGTREAVEATLGSDVREFYGRPVLRQNRTDGLKLELADDAWVLARLSGTEPVARFYAEAGTRSELDSLMRDGQRWLRGSD